MKNIIELLNFIPDIKNKLQQLGLDVHYHNSTSRSWEHNCSSADLRTNPILEQEQIDKNSTILTYLIKEKVVRGEEAKDSKNGQIEFIITDCDYSKLMTISPEEITEAQNISVPQKTLIRTFLDKEYTKSEDIMILEEELITLPAEALITIPEEKPIKVSEIAEKKLLSVLELVASSTQNSDLSKIKDNLKTLLNFNFEIGENSSSAAFPLDLRTEKLDPNNQDVKELLRKLDSLKLVRCIENIEIKTQGSNVLYLIKQIDPQALEAKAIALKNEKNDDEQFAEKALSLFQRLIKSYPYNAILKDLVKFDGKRRSMTRPYFHIRSTHPHNENSSDCKEMELIFKHIEVSYGMREEFIAQADNQERTDYVRHTTTSSSSGRTPMYVIIINIPTNQGDEEKQNYLSQLEKNIQNLETKLEEEKLAEKELAAKKLEEKKLEEKKLKKLVAPVNLSLFSQLVKPLAELKDTDFLFLVEKGNYPLEDLAKEAFRRYQKDNTKDWILMSMIAVMTDQELITKYKGWLPKECFNFGVTHQL